jgi:hypothetical protein
MGSSSQAVVHHLLASQSRMDGASLTAAHRIDQLGLGPLDLVLVALRLEALHRGNGDFPVAALDYATTVGDLVALVDRWLEGDPKERSLEGTVASGSTG